MNAFWDERWLMIQVRQESCSIMDAVQLTQEDRVSQKELPSQQNQISYF
jgi:hypothetical protein